MYDLITVGDITMDLFYQGETLTIEKGRFSLALGGKYLARNFYESLGGGAANVAVGAAKHGLKTAACGKIGDNPFRQIIIQKLTSRHVSREFLILDADYINISSILLAKSGEKTVIHYVNRKNEFIMKDSYLEAISQSKWLYIGNTPDMSLDKRLDFITRLVKYGVKICLNLGKEDCRKPIKTIKPLIEMANILILNSHEFADVVKKNYDSINFKTNCLKLLKTAVPLLILTNGKKGSAAYTSEEIYYQPALDPLDGPVVDCTGAGDAFVSGFLSKYITGGDVTEAMKAGSTYAAYVIGKIGAQ